MATFFRRHCQLYFHEWEVSILNNISLKYISNNTTDDMSQIILNNYYVYLLPFAFIELNIETRNVALGTITL